MPITVKSEREIELMTQAGQILEKVHDELAKELHAGMTTKDVDRLGEELIRSYGCIPSFLDYNGYPSGPISRTAQSLERKPKPTWIRDFWCRMSWW